MICCYSMDLLFVHLMLTTVSAVMSPAETSKSSARVQCLLQDIDRVAILQVNGKSGQCFSDSDDCSFTTIKHVLFDGGKWAQEVQVGGVKAQIIEVSHELGA